MKKNKIILVSLGLLLVLFSATVVYAKAMSYYGITTIGYGNINYAQSNGPGQWTPSRYEYTTRPYYFMNQLGATYWQVRNTCDGVTNSFSIWSTSGTYLIANNVRSMGDSIVTRMDHPCNNPNAVVGRVNYVQHWWQSSGLSGQGDTIEHSTNADRSFVDVPITHWAYYFIEAMYQMGIMDAVAIRGKYSQGQYQCPSGYFCPDHAVTRAQMAYYLERGMRGSNEAFNNYPFAGYFADVPSSYWDSKVIERLYLDGLTGGCLNYPLRYCPDNGITRGEMAVFLLRTEHGSNYTPPNFGSYYFTDTPGHWAANWIEQLHEEGITGGCTTYQYCPNNQVTQAEMAVFLERTFIGP